MKDRSINRLVEWRVSLNFNVMATLLRSPSVTPPTNHVPSLFTRDSGAARPQLQPTHVMRDTLVIDHIERPTPS